MKSLEVEAQFLTAVEAAQGNRMMTPEMLKLNWYVAVWVASICMVCWVTR